MNVTQLILGLEMRPFNFASKEQKKLYASEYKMNFDYLEVLHKKDKSLA